LIDAETQRDKVRTNFLGPDRPDLCRSEGPQHKVQLTKPFGVGIHEVTVGQFREFVRATNFVTEAESNPQHTHSFRDGRWHFVKTGYRWSDPHNAPSDDHPVVQITFNDAQTGFCDWLSKKDGVAYRLPKEAEWEYATRAGTAKTWFFGNHEGPIGDYAWYVGNGENRTNPVGRKKPNPWGLHDVYGNVSEWCDEQFDAKYYERREGKDPRGAPVSIPDLAWHVIRGGHIAYNPEDCRSAGRAREFGHRSQNLLGFRVVSAPWTPSQEVRLARVRHVPVHQYQVVGGTEPFEVAVRSGDVAIIDHQERSPAHFLVIPNQEKGGEYALDIRWPGQPEKVTVADTLLGTAWDVSFFARTSASGNRNVQNRVRWQRMLTQPPLLQGRVPQLDFRWREESPGADVPNDDFALVATTEIDLSEEMAGRYRLGVAADDGVRVYVDDRLVIDLWNHGPNRPTWADVDWTPGKHRLRVEYFEAGGDAWVQFRVRKVGSFGAK
jgi:formylglycine-generating enzyme required for sulfatase activity